MPPHRRSQAGANMADGLVHHVKPLYDVVNAMTAASREEVAATS